MTKHNGKKKGLSYPNLHSIYNVTFQQTKKFMLSKSHSYSYHKRECKSATALLKKHAANSKKFCKIPQTSKMPTAMIKKTQKQYRNELLK